MFGRVLLVAPYSPSHMGAARPPTGLGYLAQSLQAHGVACQVVDLRTRERWADVVRAVASFRPDLIGVSLVSYGYRRSYALIERIKQHSPNTPIVVGGPHVTIMGQRVFVECPAIDYAVARDGEVPLVDLCLGQRPLGEVAGLYARDGSAIVAGPPPVVNHDLDSIPFPRYEGFDLARYATEIPLVTSRGCPYRCVFCPNSVMRSQFVARSAANVVDEIEHWYARGVRQFNVDDDNFALINARVYAICDEIDRRGLTGLFLRCANGVRADSVDRPLLARMRQVGFCEIGIGADGGNNHALALANKGETIEDIENAIRAALDVGINVKLFTVLGLPGETMADIEDSLALAQRYPFLRAQLYAPIPYPGTALYQWVESHGAFLVPPDEFLNGVTDNEGITPVFETPELPAAARVQIMRRARAIERAVTARAVTRMLGRLPFAGLAGWLFASNLGQRAFFQNRWFRAITDRLWYRKSVARRS